MNEYLLGIVNCYLKMSNVIISLTLNCKIIIKSLAFNLEIYFKKIMGLYVIFPGRFLTEI